MRLGARYPCEWCIAGHDELEDLRACHDKHALEANQPALSLDELDERADEGGLHGE